MMNRSIAASLSIVMGLACLAYPATAQSAAEKELAATAARLEIQHQAASYQSQNLINKALEMRARGRLADALELACDASAADPGNISARKLKEELQVLVVGAGSSMMGREMDRMAILGQIQAHRASVEKAADVGAGTDGGNSSKNSGKAGSMSDNKSETRRAPGKMTVPSENDREVIRKQRSIQERMAMEFENQLNDAQELKIPYRGEVNYPDDWARRAELRDRETEAARRPIGP